MAAPFPGHDSPLPLKDKITAAIEGATGAESPVTAFFNAWERLGLVNDYARFVHELKEALKIELDNANIRATVSSRVKSNSSIEKSIIRRREARERSYNNLDEIFKGIHDLAGFRIIVDFPSGIPAAQNLVEMFKVVGKSDFCADRDLGLDWKPRFGAFESTNYRVKIDPRPDHALYIYREVLIEIQVLSLAESLYNKLAHPLVYKNTSGQVPVKDQKLIDVTHGLALCYWICLSCMQDQLEDQEIPNEVRKLGAIGEDAQIEKDISELVQVTPRLPPRAAPTTIKTIGSGFTSNKFANISNSSGFGHVNHAPTTYNNYYTGEPNSSNAYVKALFITDPRVDKEEIQDRKGGLLLELSDWILQHDDFKNWERDATSRILWVSGEPGKGKTMLMCRIIDELSPRTNLSYFFCEANEPNTNNATSVLRGLIYLLIQQDDVAMSYFEKECQRYGKQYFENRSFTLTQLRKAFLTILAALIPKPIYLAVDALDECVEGQRALLEIITGNSHLQNVKWVVSSRNKPLIMEYLERASKSISLERNDVSVSAAVTEYTKYKAKLLFERKQYEERMMQQVMDLLFSKAQSTFLWVSLACEMLAKRESFDPVSVLGDFPPGLDSLYKMMLDEVRIASSYRIYQQIMAVVLTVLRPISMHELESLAPLFPKGLREDKMIEVIRYCGCFLSVRETFIYFVHESAKDFLLNHNYGFAYDAQQQHYEILMASLKAMAKLPLIDGFELVKYPCTKWAFHVSRCRPEVQAEELRSGSHIDEFLRESYLEWFKALGYLRAVSDGILCMLELSLQVSGDNSGFSKLIREEASFMRYHSHTSSLIRKVYGKKEPRWITLKPDVDNSSNAAIHSLEGHTSTVEDISFSYDGRLLASASFDRTVRIWDVVTGESMHILEGHTSSLTSVAFSGSNYRLASASSEAIIIWDAESGEHMKSIDDRINSSLNRSVALSKDGSFLFGSSQEGFKLWNSETGSLIRKLPHKLETAVPLLVTKSAISACDKYLAGADDWSVLLWDSETGAMVYEIEFQGFGIEYPLLKFSSQNILWVLGRKMFFLLDPVTKEIRGQGKRSEMIFQLNDESRDGGKLPLASNNSQPTIMYHKVLDWVERYDKGSKSNLLATSGDRNIEIRDLAIPDSASAQIRERDDFHRVSFLPNGIFILSSPSRLPVSICHFETRNVTLKIYFQLVSRLLSPVVAARGETIAYVEHGSLSIINLSTGVKYSELEQEIRKRNDRCIILGAFSSDGKWIALGSSRHIQVYDIEKRKHCQRFESHRSAYNMAAVFSNNSRYLAVGSIGSIRIWDTNSWTERVLAIPHKERFQDRHTVSLLFSEDDSSLICSSYLLSSTPGTRINIWKLVAGDEFRTFTLDISCKFESFDSDLSFVTTNVGMFGLTQDKVYSRGYALSRDGQWVLWCTKPVLWLPPEFRPKEKAESFEVCKGHKIVIGLASGGVLLLEFDPSGPTADLGRPSFLEEPVSYPPGTSRDDRLFLPITRREPYTG
ncbi:vegetative incompatibility het-e-1 [Fusarium pseudocircinatum]|uniref:Vegetative incompatibility het-e-1 n=1 Tax=Fusarium pseudocircinatum TaxID=56676 RepID=A0A8H5PUW2_9HYPO|nr:vegetative incompatibility het-e-1 [Fusarium pseudocircinatum]